MQTINYKIFTLHAGDRVLDLGCGEGRHVISTYAEGHSSHPAAIHSVGVDLSLKDLQIAQRRFQDFAPIHHPNKQFSLAAASALQLPFADRSFDKVLCSEVLEHIPDYQAALAEIYRVLKPGGLLAISVPRYFPEKICWWLSDEYHANEGGHLRIFKARPLRHDVERFGMRFISQHWAHALHTPFWWLQCLFWSTRDSNPLIKIYHRFLVWDLMQRPWITQTLESVLNPVCGKSVVMYFSK